MYTDNNIYCNVLHLAMYSISRLSPPSQGENKWIWTKRKIMSSLNYRKFNVDNIYRKH